MKTDLSISDSGKIRTFTACFRSQRPLQTCGPGLKTKLYEKCEAELTQILTPLMQAVQEQLLKNYLKYFKDYFELDTR